MADIIKILSDVKGKVLDVVHFDILKAAYELQNENIEQLKTNNEAFKENNNLLKEKTSVLEKENVVLKQNVSKLETELSGLRGVGAIEKLSEVAENILKKCFELDITEFNDEDMIRILKRTKVEVQSAIDELCVFDFIRPPSIVVGFGSGCDYDLTPSGKKKALDIGKKA